MPVSPRYQAKHKEEKRKLLRMEFATFCAAHPDAVPNRAGWTAIDLSLLSWNPWQGVFLRLVERLH